MLVTLNEILKNLKGAAACFNVVDYEMARGIIAAAEESESPVIIGTATRHWEKIGGTAFAPSIHALCREAKVPVALHLDHASPDQLDIVRDALLCGYTSIMIDGSKESFEKNIEITGKVSELAHSYGAGVEGELGSISGAEGVAEVVDNRIKKGAYTNPDNIAEFLKETGIDALAVSVGTVHGLYKSEPEIQFELIERIASLSSVPLVMHGASGISDHDIKKAVRCGIKKINYFSGLLVRGMRIINRWNDPENNDYMTLRKELREGWKDEASKQILLYKGDN